MMDVKVSKAIILTDGLVEKTSAMLDKTKSKIFIFVTKKMINKGKRSKTLSAVKPVENISKNLQSFLEISPVQKEVLL